MSWATTAISRLRAGERVTIRPRGNSMTPRIRSGEEVELEPVTRETVLEVGDVVLVHVHGSDYLHLIGALRGKGAEAYYRIENAHGHVNGWARRDHVYGRKV